MFKRPVLFVVGAGASYELGLPLGAGLRDTIAAMVDFRFHGRQLQKGDADLLAILRSRYDTDKSDITRLNKYFRAGSDLFATMSRFPSVDEALHYWSERKEAVELGKVAIAQQLLQAERRSKIFNKNDRSRADVDAAGGSWLVPFVEIAMSGLRQEDAGKAFQNVTVVNFNYDRVVEHFLYWSLQLHFKVSADAAAEAVTGLKTIRPYGSLGALEWKDKNAGIPYGTEPRDVDVCGLAEGIRTYTEQTEGSKIKEQISYALEDAELVVFLGFGFHQQNASLLYPIERHRRSHVRQVLATVIKIDVHNHEPIIENIRYAMGLGRRALLLPITSVELLTNLRPMISMTVG